MFGSGYYSSQYRTQEHSWNIKNVKIIRKVERQLLNKWIRSANTIKLSILQRNTCAHQLGSVWDEVTFRQCQAFINRILEAIYKGIWGHQKGKSNILWYTMRGDHPKVKKQQRQQIHVYIIYWPFKPCTIR